MKILTFAQHFTFLKTFSTYIFLFYSCSSHDVLLFLKVFTVKEKIGSRKVGNLLEVA